ncbi:metallophosphoesterase [Olivibacter ginsenosidimutans]
MGDIHGAYKAMQQCLERSDFDYENDILIQLGDVVDGYDEVFECVEELLKIKQVIAIKGNHDVWFSEFLETDFHPGFWNFGGEGTIISYLRHSDKKGVYLPSRSSYKTTLHAADIPDTHLDFFRNQKPYYIDKDQCCFVHGGFDRHFSFWEQQESIYYWDRDLWRDAMHHSNAEADLEAFEIVTKFKKIYLGHTPTTNWGTDQPLTAFHITNLDTGAGHSGRLTIMNIDSQEYWQSDPLKNLYKKNFRN